MTQYGVKKAFFSFVFDFDLESNQFYCTTPRQVIGMVRDNNKLMKLASYTKGDCAVKVIEAIGSLNL